MTANSTIRAQSQAWIKTIEDGRGYQAPDPDAFRKMLKQLGRHDLYKAMERHLPISAAVLDAGCGWATESFGLASRGNAVLAVDISEKLISDLQLLKTRLGAPYDKNLTFAVQDIFELNRTGWSFDAVISDGTYEHFIEKEEREDFLRNVRSVLRPHGLFIVGVPNLHNPLFSFVVNSKMPAMLSFTVESLAEELKQGDLRILECGYSFANVGFGQWTRFRWMIPAVMAANSIFPFLPKALKRIFSAHLYCVARLP